MLRTTNFILDLEHNSFSNLKKKLSLYRYRLPQNFNYSDKRHLKTHNEYKDKLDRPYYFHSHVPAIYVLLNKKEKPQPINFEYLNHLSKGQQIGFNEIRWSEILKILFSQFFYNSDKLHRICQNKIYAIGKTNEEFATAVHIDLRANSAFMMKPEKFEEFFIVPQIKYFHKANVEKINPDFLYQNQFYEQVISKNGAFFSQIKPKEVLNCQSYKKNKIWIPSKPNKSRPTKFNWHSDDANWKNSLGYIIYNFQENFSKYLKDEFDIRVEAKLRDSCKPYTPRIKNRRENKYSNKKDGYTVNGIPIHALKKIFVFDNRLIENDKLISTVPLQEYIDFLNDFSTENRLKVKFEKIIEEEFTPSTPVLILQDYTPEDFKAGSDGLPTGFLSLKGFADPYKSLYKKHSQIPKQSLNVNPNNSSDFNDNPFSYQGYFQYQIDKFKLEQDKIIVCLNELFLKKKILNSEPLMGSDTHEDFPINEGNLLWDLAYISRKAILFFENGVAKFIDFESPEGKLKRKELLKSFNLNWNDDVIKKHKTKYPYSSDKQLETTKFIIGKNLVIEIEENQDKRKERILYNYAGIKERKKENPKASARSKDLILGYQGIWFDPSDNAYSVGAYQAFNKKQPKAHIIRKFSGYRNDNDFDIQLLLESLAVEFVRNKQFTVYPFFFDLLKLYQE